jgi:hypothetical protein
VRGFVFLGVCCLFQIGAGLSRVSMPLLMIACSCKRGAPTVFKCVWHVLVLDGTFRSARHANAAGGMRHGGGGTAALWHGTRLFARTYSNFIDVKWEKEAKALVPRGRL